MPVSAEQYEGIGRVVVAATTLEQAAAYLAWALRPDAFESHDWERIPGKPGAALRELRLSIAQWSADPRLTEIERRIEELLSFRHRIVHDLPITYGDVTMHRALGTMAMNPRTGGRMPYPKVAQLERAQASMHEIAGAAIAIANERLSRTDTSP